jgi:DNA-binding response OmpR family regulator
MDALVVDDEPDIRALVAHHLEREGFRVRPVSNGTDALREARAHPPDVIILDLMLPGMDGLEVCRRLRSDGATANAPIIMLTAKADEVDRIVGLEMGADDYVVKPFSPKELIARVRAVLRRNRPRPDDKPLVLGPIVLDIGRHRVEVGGTAVSLAPREFALLQALLEAPGRVLTREQLLRRAWGHAHAEDIESRTVDVHVRRLRAKLGDAGRFLLTIKGIGYQMAADS